jgi:hypothetical protein
MAGPVEALDMWPYYYLLVGSKKTIGIPTERRMSQSGDKNRHHLVEQHVFCRVQGAMVLP